MFCHRSIAGATLALLLGTACLPASDQDRPAAATATSTRPLGALGAAPRFTLFESGQVRPLALSPNGQRLYAVNTPDNRLEIFDVGPHGLTHRGSVAVGLEPVAVAARGAHEVWVVNHLSDSISIVDAQWPAHPRVVRTLLVGDEPRDLVFAGPGRRRAFVTTAHRGQNLPLDPQFFTPGVGRADVWVFDAASLGGSPGGTPLTIVTLFTDTPRGLAVSPDGSRVYAAGFHTGNRTTTINELYVPDGGEVNGGLPEPRTNADGVPQPETGLIVKFDGTSWVDAIGRIWDHIVFFSLPDRDVFALDAMANPPRLVDGSDGWWSGVGTVLFNLAVNPVSGKVYVANTDANNLQRFEGPGLFAGDSLRGHLHESRITVLSPGSVTPRHLNKHIDYQACCAPLPNEENERSLAFPQAMAVSSDGATLFVAGFGSSKIGVYDTAALEADTFVPGADQIPLPGGGPSGLVLDEARGRLYVLTRFDNAISVVQVASRQVTQHLAMFNPEPESVVAGRPFLYDASHTSSHGDSACASCHVFGDVDSLAWDLGDPDGASLANGNPIIPSFLVLDPSQVDPTFRSLKGPMTSQSLRGMSNHGPMHWRGDRNGGLDAPTAQPDSGAFDEEAGFKKFNGAFVGLLGRHAPLEPEEMQAFTDFTLQIVYPPNPIRRLDNALTPDEQVGRDHFFTTGAEGPTSCADCHTIDPEGNASAGVRFPGFFGTSGLSVFLTLDPVRPQAIKIPHLRNAYTKVGMFGSPPSPLFGGTTTEHVGDQVRGFGLQHDGSADNLPSFFAVPGFAQPISPHGFLLGPAGDQLRLQTARFILAMDTNLRPIVGQQITLAAGTAVAATPRVNLLVARAAAGDCELVARTRALGRELGFLYTGGRFVPDVERAPALTDGALRLLALVTGHPLTYTCVPIGSGRRMGVDADLDGHLDGDEDLAGSDPRDPTSVP